MSQFRVLFADVVCNTPIRDHYGHIVGWEENNWSPAPVKNFRSEQHYDYWRNDVASGHVDRLSASWTARNTQERMVRHRQYGLVPASFFGDDDM